MKIIKALAISTVLLFSTPTLAQNDTTISQVLTEACEPFARKFLTEGKQSAVNSLYSYVVEKNMSEEDTKKVISICTVYLKGYYDGVEFSKFVI